MKYSEHEMQEERYVLRQLKTYLAVYMEDEKGSEEIAKQTVNSMIAQSRAAFNRFGFPKLPKDEGDLRVKESLK